MAVILPILMTLVLGALEIGRGIMVKHVLEEAARSACRDATLGNGLASEAEATVDQKMTEAGIGGYTTTVTSTSIGAGAALKVTTVTISVPHSQVAWFSSPRFMTGSVLTGECMMFSESNVPGS
jgi:Flp pilus assembly protein TadG